MVTDSFGKRNFMQQPMGRPKHAIKVSHLAFFPLKFGGGEDCFFNFLGFPMYVPNKFPMGSQYVPQVPNVFPNMFFRAPHLYPICLDN